MRMKKQWRLIKNTGLIINSQTDVLLVDMEDKSSQTSKKAPEVHKAPVTRRKDDLLLKVKVARAWIILQMIFQRLLQLMSC